MFIELWPVKGGIGTSVIAATLATKLAEPNQNILIMTKNKDEVADQVAIWGRSGIDVEQWDYAYHLANIRNYDDLADPRVYISCTWYNKWYQPKPDDRQFDHTIVIRTPQMQNTASMFPERIEAIKIQIVENSYMALSRAAKSDNQYDLSIVFTTEGNVLSMNDCTAVLGESTKKVFEWKRDPAIQRALDAGVYTGRMPRHINQSFNVISHHIQERNSYASNK